MLGITNGGFASALIDRAAAAGPMTIKTGPSRKRTSDLTAGIRKQLSEGYGNHQRGGIGRLSGARRPQMGNPGA